MSDYHIYKRILKGGLENEKNNSPYHDREL
jgi:hypothetical protein